ncbi:MAG: adenosylcobinamide-GDP ribazoletransferase [Candidatus Omnitrophica bacterium]|nr:adenosylcobinamide-GDP ribazoletransferase [Candidatus Omnitrophota bacterium]
MIKSFIAALRFLTIVPLSRFRTDEKDLARSTVYFPLVGLFLGLALFGAYTIFVFLRFDHVLIGILLALALTVLTGGLHLDGLADTCDAFGSGKSKDEMLRIMRDPHIGAMGAIGLIADLALKASLLSMIGRADKCGALIAMCVISRWNLASSLCLFPYARPDGKAKIFKNGTGKKMLFPATLMALLCIGIVRPVENLCAFGIAAGAVYLINKASTRKIGGITGDTLGLANELAEIVTLGTLYIMERGAL